MSTTIPLDVKAVEKSLSGLGSLIFLFFILSQFVAYFSYTNLGNVMALKLADLLNNAGIGPFWLLMGSSPSSSSSTCSSPGRSPSGPSSRRCSCRCWCR